MSSTKNNQGYESDFTLDVENLNNFCVFASLQTTTPTMFWFV